MCLGISYLLGNDMSSYEMMCLYVILYVKQFVFLIGWLI
uniref:Uncharacterized protein n=1 Tax=Rhizophora mucronata TaxID=61149 RepID=A0A2P2PPA4_RHIMU